MAGKRKKELIPGKVQKVIEKVEKQEKAKEARSKLIDNGWVILKGKTIK